MNTITHLVGASLGLGGMVVVIIAGALSGDGWKLASALFYGIGLFLLFLFSTLYHGLQGSAKAVFHRFDHIGIHLLIAGTYTPFALVTLRDSRGFLVFGLAWAIAVGGIVFKSIWGPRFMIASTALYLISGWIILIDLAGLRAGLEPAGLTWLISGGVLYTIGVVFFANPKIPFHHEIWHLFVLAGAACHYVAVLFYVIL